MKKNSLLNRLEPILLTLKIELYLSLLELNLENVFAETHQD
jgi:hypothetical protein